MSSSNNPIVTIVQHLAALRNLTMAALHRATLAFIFSSINPGHDAGHNVR